MLLFRNKLQTELHTLVEAHVKQKTFSGVVLVEQKGKILLHQAYGMANLEHSLPMTLESRFNIGSISKTFTALAVLKLEQQGHLNVQDPLNKYLPDFAGEYLTLHHLLSNTSGLPDYLMQESDTGWYAQPYAAGQLLERIAHQPRLFAPGERLGYSNSNWVLLVMVVEKLTGKPWAEALRSLVLQPYGLEHTLVGESSKPIPKRAGGYRLEGDQLLAAQFIDPSVEVGAGGIFSTAGDLLKLEKALIRDPIYPRMATPIAEDSGLAYGYGLIFGKRFDRVWVGHSGGTFGYASFLTRYPAEDATIIVLSNLENGSVMRLEADLAAVLLGQPYELPTAQKWVQVAPEMLRQHVGTYRSEFMGRPMNFQVQEEHGSLTVQFSLLPKAKLQALSEHRFVGRIKGGEVIFSFRSDGVTLDWAGTLMECPRI